MATALGETESPECIEVFAGDKGYFKLDEISILQELGIGTVVSDPQIHRRLDKLSDSDLAVLDAAKDAAQSPLGKQLSRDRAEKVERSFEHVLDCGGARRTTLRGRENIRKRYLIQAACANLSLLMRHLIGVGTPKQALAVPHALEITLYVGLLAYCLAYNDAESSCV
jgi:transposase